mgnify:CR=1 FL=1
MGFFNKIFGSSAPVSEETKKEQEAQRQFDLLRDTGVRALRAHEMKTAIDCLSQAHTMRPEEAETLSYLVEALLQAQAFEEAMPLLKKLSEMEKQKEELRKAELRTLQSQINPHFLFNSLNTISYFCREKPEKARELLLALSSYFRSMLEDTDYMVTLDTELEHVKAYTMLEEARFEKRLSIEINADPEALRSCVPNLILQPIVENAVHHGAMQREKGVGKVIVNVKREERSTRIDVIDNGPGMDYRIVQSLYGGEKVEHTGIGMMNVQQRLISLYGKSYGLQIVTSEEGTDVRMNIPDSAAGSAQQEKTIG